MNWQESMHFDIKGIKFVDVGPLLRVLLKDPNPNIRIPGLKSQRNNFISMETEFNRLIIENDQDQNVECLIKVSSSQYILKTDHVART